MDFIEHGFWILIIIKFSRIFQNFKCFFSNKIYLPNYFQFIRKQNEERMDQQLLFDLYVTFGFYYEIRPKSPLSDIYIFASNGIFSRIK